MKSPKVSVICLCHNHAQYVAESIQSVQNQSYLNVELIVIDDGSTDGGKEVIAEIIKDSAVKFIDIEESLGNCKAFNKGLEASTGDYIIDLAADDLLWKNRIEEGIRTFSIKNIGVEFCNVMHIDQNGIELGPHFATDKKVPEGDLYEKFITTYFISPPGMMIKRSVLTDLGGYDENLSYEDFDFWIRSSRKYQYGYTDQVLVTKRDVPDSLSKRQFRFLSADQKSTLAVCQKIKKLNRTQQEKKALIKRCAYEVKNCLMQGNLSLIPSFIRLCF